MNLVSDATSTWRVGARIARAAYDWHDQPALTVDGVCWRYWELLAAATHLALRLDLPVQQAVLPVTAIMADRHVSSYIGILAALIQGHTYVPINVHHPVSRNLQALRRSGARQLICGARSMASLAAILSEAPDLRAQLRIIEVGDEQADYPLMLGAPFPPQDIAANAIAYVLFTSGSTGEPKGVPISQHNLTSYLDAVGKVLDIVPTDRLSQTFELTFDLSVHDLLVAWTRGAHLLVPRACDLASPVDFIRDQRITCWFSVPTLAFQAQLQRRLEPGALPSLRWSLFCGEALPMDLARCWMIAAPQSRVENWYGPTEATIACARHLLNDFVVDQVAPNDLAPIGIPFSGMTMKIVNEALFECLPGEPGELLLSGRQVAAGYLHDPKKTNRSFVKIPGCERRYYRTGDRAVRDKYGVIWFLGRLDDQIKIRGFRVELGEIETLVRSTLPTVNVVALSWPPDAVSGSSIVVILEAVETSVSEIFSVTQAKLPSYMVPSRVLCLPRFPVNASGKSDRKAIAKQVQDIFDREYFDAAFNELDPGSKLLLKIVLRISPQLQALSVVQCKSLLDAGMDSLSFVALTVELEQAFSVKLDHDLVAEIAEIPFSSILSTLLRVGANIPISLEAKKMNVAEKKLCDLNSVRMTPRVNRVFQFIERFPPLMRTSAESLIPVVGSSGVFRGFSPSIFDAVAAQNDRHWRSINIGLPAIDCESIARVCEFVRRCSDENGRRFPMAIYELDPMMLSVIPPAGDIRLTSEHFVGVFSSSNTVDDDFRWVSDTAGAPNFSSTDMGKAPTLGSRLQPHWQLKREQEIIQVFLGLVEMNSSATNWWLAGLRHLEAVADCVTVFVHPIDRSRVKSRMTDFSDGHWMRLRANILKEVSARFIDWDAFDLQSSDFFDVNHVCAENGGENLTRQLALMVFGDDNNAVHSLLQ